MPPPKAEAVPEEDIHTDKVLPPPQPPFFAIPSRLIPVALGGLETKIPKQGSQVQTSHHLSSETRCTNQM